MIEQALHAYTAAAETAFEVARHPPRTRGGLLELRNRADQLRVLVEQLEEGREFNELLEEPGRRSAMAGTGARANRHGGMRSTTFFAARASIPAPSQAQTRLVPCFKGMKQRSNVAVSRRHTWRRWSSSTFLSQN